MRRDRVVYIPLVERGSKSNASVTSVIQILRKNYMVSGNLATPADFVQMLHTKAVFLSWVEQTLDLGMKMRLLLYKALGAKIVWFFHNRQPHDAEDVKKMRKNMLWLADRSTAIILYSKCSRRHVPNVKRNGRKAVFVPHILFKDEKNDPAHVENIRNNYGIGKDDFVFTIFGFVQPYKNIEGGIEAFKQLGQEHTKLLVVGSAYSRSYAKEIAGLCEGCENIILDLRYVSDYTLGAILSMSDVVVVPYKNSSSMNSGVMIQAFSQGRTVIAPDICMARDMAREGFFYMYHNHDDLKSFMEKAYKNGKDANRAMGMRAKRYVTDNNNEQMVYSALMRMLNEDA